MGDAESISVNRQTSDIEEWGALVLLRTDNLSLSIFLSLSSSLSLSLSLHLSLSHTHTFSLLSLVKTLLVCNSDLINPLLSHPLKSIIRITHQSSLYTYTLRF